MPSLYRHPDTPSGAIQAIDAELERIDGGAIATFRAHGDISKLVLPPSAERGRSGDLWKATCFELFVERGGSRYCEFNLSPSGVWAAYEFDDYRQGMRDAPAEISIKVSKESNRLKMVAVIQSEFPESARVGLSAVIEEDDGAIRLWATSFAPGKPDFHHKAVRSLILDTVSAA